MPDADQRVGPDDRADNPEEPEQSMAPRKEDDRADAEPEDRGITFAHEQPE